MFALNVCAYAVMSNHYHVVLHINVAQAQGWTETEVILRWHSLYKGNLLSHKYLAGEVLYDEQLEALAECVATWRERLTSLGWFMRTLNEGIARKANFEGGCTGRFWEGRFKSQELLDEKALAVCMAYVDLNPVRAKMVDIPKSSEFTSAKRRVDLVKEDTNPGTPNQPRPLFPFVGYPRDTMPVGLPFHLQDYLELLDWTGRQLRKGKRGTIDDNQPPILDECTSMPTGGSIPRPTSKTHSKASLAPCNPSSVHVETWDTSARWAFPPVSC